MLETMHVLQFPLQQLLETGLVPKHTQGIQLELHSKRYVHLHVE
jgi:hypothetical protein